MEFHEVVKTRRSVRKYSPRPIEEAVLSRILDAARIAPSGSNRQPWKFIVVKDHAIREKLVGACNNQKFLAEAPAVVVACSLKITSNRGGYMGEHSVLIDVSIAFDHLILAARNEGLGTCWIGAFENTAVKEILHVPEEAQVVAITPLGYPEDDNAFQSVSHRKAMEEVIVYDRWA